MAPSPVGEIVDEVMRQNSLADWAEVTLPKETIEKVLTAAIYADRIANVRARGKGVFRKGEMRSPDRLAEDLMVEAEDHLKHNPTDARGKDQARAFTKALLKRAIAQDRIQYGTAEDRPPVVSETEVRQKAVRTPASARDLLVELDNGQGVTFQMPIVNENIFISVGGQLVGSLFFDDTTGNLVLGRFSPDLDDWEPAQDIPFWPEV